MSAAERYARSRLEKLCERLGIDGDPLTTPGPMRDLAMSVVAALRAGREPAELTEDLDKLDDLLLTAGYAAGLGEHRGSPLDGPVPAHAQLPGLGGGHPVLHVLGCPGERCPRVALPSDAAAAARVCGVFGEPMRAVRLRP